MSGRDELNDHLFGDLDPERRARVDARIARDPELSVRAAELAAMVDRLEGVPRAAWDYVDERTKESATVTAPDSRLSRLRLPLHLRPRVALAGLAGAAALAAAVLAILLTGSSAPGRQTVRLSALAGAPRDSWATATITGAKRISVSVKHLPATDARHHYELWLMTSPSDLVPVGSFRVHGGGSAELSASLPAAPRRYRYLDISLQPDGSGAISNVSLLRGPTSSS